MFHNNIVKISEILNKCNLLKTHPNYLHYWFLHKLQPFLLWEKMDFLKTDE